MTLVSSAPRHCVETQQVLSVQTMGLFMRRHRTNSSRSHGQSRAAKEAQDLSVGNINPAKLTKMLAATFGAQSYEIQVRETATASLLCELTDTMSRWYIMCIV